MVVRKGTEERKHALADLAIARRAVSFPLHDGQSIPPRSGNGRGERPPKLREPTSRPILLYAEAVNESKRSTNAGCCGAT